MQQQQKKFEQVEHESRVIYSLGANLQCLNLTGVIWHVGGRQGGPKHTGATRSTGAVATAPSASIFSQLTT
jgi:hypothetical protein